MNLLEIMRLANTLSGLQGEIDTVANLKDIQVDLYQFVRQSNIGIQLKRKDWKFMNGTIVGSLTTLVNTVSNPLVAQWNKVIYNKSVLRYVPYDDYLLQDWTPPSEPKMYTIVPETNSLLFNTLNGSYSVTIRYYKAPVDITDDFDVSIIPVMWHGLIAYKAAADFGSWLGNPEIEDKNLTEYDLQMMQMMRNEVPARTANITPLA